MAEVVAILDFSIRIILAIFDLQVVLLLPTKFRVDWHFSSGEEVQQEAHGPQVAHLSDIATADMQMLCNIFQSCHRN